MPVFILSQSIVWICSFRLISLDAGSTKHHLYSTLYVPNSHFLIKSSSLLYDPLTYLIFSPPKSRWGTARVGDCSRSLKPRGSGKSQGSDPRESTLKTVFFQCSAEILGEQFHFQSLAPSPVTSLYSFSNNRTWRSHLLCPTSLLSLSLLASFLLHPIFRCVPAFSDFQLIYGQTLLLLRLPIHPRYHLLRGASSDPMVPPNLHSGKQVPFLGEFSQAWSFI